MIQLFNKGKLIYFFSCTGHCLGLISSGRFLFLGELLEEKISIVSYIAKKDLILDDNTMQTRTNKANLLQSTLHEEKKKRKTVQNKKEAICLKIPQITHIVPHKSSKSQNILNADSKSCLPTIHSFHSKGRILIPLFKKKKKK